MSEDTKKIEEDKEEKDSQHYELIYLISNKYSEDELEPIKSNVLKLIKDNGGQITYQEDWGKRKLVYSIKNFFHAYYQLIEFDLLPEKLKNIDKTLRLSEEIIRHLVVKKKIKTEAEKQKEKIIAAKIAKKEEEAEELKTGDKKEERNVTMEELDEKLDKILNTDTLNI